MKVSEIVKNPGYTLISCQGESNEVQNGYTSDLMSDVTANARKGSILITIQAQKNTVEVAVLAGIAAILICNGKEVPEDMIEEADKKKIAVIRTAYNQFEASILIYQLLK